MGLVLEDVGFEDGDAIAKICISAFFDDPFQKTLYPGMPFDKQVAGVVSRWPRNYGDVCDHYKKVTETDSGETVSYSKWSFAFTDAAGALRKPSGGIFRDSD